MKLASPTSQFESFESELIRRFFHPKSFFYLCFINQIELLAQSESEISNAAAVNTINRLVTNLVSARDAYAEWKQLVRQPGLEELHLVLSGKIIWLNSQKFAGEELRHAIEAVAQDLIDKFLQLFRQENTRRILMDFPESEVAVSEFPSEFFQPAEYPERDVAEAEPDQERDDFATIADELPVIDPTDDFLDPPISAESKPAEADTTIEFDGISFIEGMEKHELAEVPPEPISAEAANPPEIQTPENLLYEQFKSESILAIQLIIEKYQYIRASEPAEKRFRLLRKKLPELIALSMIQGNDTIEYLSLKLLNLIPVLEKSENRIQKAYFELAEDALKFMLNWLNGAVSEADIHDKFFEIQSFTEAMKEVPPKENADKVAPEIEVEPRFSERASEECERTSGGKGTVEAIDWPEKEAAEEIIDAEELIFDLVTGDSSEIAEGEFGISEKNAPEICQKRQKM